MNRRDFLKDIVKKLGGGMLAYAGLLRLGISHSEAMQLCAGSTASSGEAQQLYGNSDTYDSSYSTSNIVRATTFTTTAAFTCSYGWFYVCDVGGEGTGTFQLAIYDSTRTSQVGTCSTSGTVPASGSEAWVEVTWGTPPSLSASTQYWIVACSDDMPSNMEVFYVGANDGYYYSSGACPTAPSIGPTYDPLLCVANYNAK